MSDKASPKSALIFYCTFLPNQPVPNVDKITQLGCSGQLVLEKTDKVSDLVQLLGLYDQSNAPMKEILARRFNEMPLQITSYDSNNASISIPESGVKLIDFTNTENAWDIINNGCALDRPETLVCIVSEINQNEERKAEFMPQQSYWMKGGVKVEEIEKGRSLIYSYFHCGSTRRDSVEHFGQDIVRLSGNKKILAWHFLAEIGNKLGFVAKYGS